jgi:hypothetical protein
MSGIRTQNFILWPGDVMNTQPLPTEKQNTQLSNTRDVMDSIKSTRNLDLSVISANQNILINDHSKSTVSTVKYNYKTVIFTK